jgi:hypothetical protein
MAQKASNREEWTVVRDRAEKFATDAKTVAAVQAALARPDQIPSAIKDPERFFASHGVKIPPSLEVEVADRELRTLPGPEWFPFVIEFFNCRTYWVRKCDNQAPPLCKWIQETVCFGFRIYPRGFPRLG